LQSPQIPKEIPMPILTDSEHIVLTILHGCPNGSTEFNLTTRCDVKPGTLYRLIERGLVQPEERRIRPPHGWPILWMTITEHGRKALRAETH
jgi:hypothetical protein